MKTGEIELQTVLAQWSAEIDDRRPGICCTFDIPSALRDVLEERLRFHNCALGDYVEILLRRYRYLLARGEPVPVARRTTLYQEAGQDLLKRNFRCEPGVWRNLRLWAFACGVSACFLFIWLLKHEMLYRAEAGHIPDMFGGDWARTQVGLMLSVLLMPETERLDVRLLHPGGPDP